MTPGFQSPFLSVRTADGRNVAIVEDAVWAAKDGLVVTLKAGATSDGGSTPRFLWGLLPPFGAEWRAYVLHDFLYRCTTLPREACDNYLYEALLGLGVSKVRAWEIYEGVRLGGSSSFAADRAAQTPAHLEMLALAA